MIQQARIDELLEQASLYKDRARAAESDKEWKLLFAIANDCERAATKLAVRLSEQEAAKQFRRPLLKLINGGRQTPTMRRPPH